MKKLICSLLIVITAISMIFIGCGEDKIDPDRYYGQQDNSRTPYLYDIKNKKLTELKFIGDNISISWKKDGGGFAYGEHKRIKEWQNNKDIKASIKLRFYDTNTNHWSIRIEDKQLYHEEDDFRRYSIEEKIKNMPIKGEQNFINPSSAVQHGDLIVYSKIKWVEIEPSCKLEKYNEFKKRDDYKSDELFTYIYNTKTGEETRIAYFNCEQIYVSPDEKYLILLEGNYYGPKI